MSTKVFGRLFLALRYYSSKAEVRKQREIQRFRREVRDAKHILFITGAGAGEASTVPCYRLGSGSFRSYQSFQFASMEAWKQNPSLVWEFYHFLRETIRKKQPNQIHKLIARKQEEVASAAQKISVITQCIDGLHTKAGCKDTVELHGSVFRTRCDKCGNVEHNTNSPICEALRDTGNPELYEPDAFISETNLPSCSQCGTLVRPDVILQGESIRSEILDKAGSAIVDCDLCIVIGLYSTIYPASCFSAEQTKEAVLWLNAAAMLVPQIAARGGTVAEFDSDIVAGAYSSRFKFGGPIEETFQASLLNS